jgi:magnesium chelatase family protein
MNPCPCGHSGSPLRACRCTPDLVARYQGRLSGPLLDRIDLQVEVPAVAPQTLAGLPTASRASPWPRAWAPRRRGNGRARAC